MMSLGVSKGRVIPSTDEDRKRIIKQMKVRTTLKGDKSWIQHHNSDSEDEKSSPLSGRAGGGSPASTPSAPQSDRSPASKPQSGYLIRGVFTKTIDKTSSVPDSSSCNAAQKSTAAKGRSLCHSNSGYRMTTEDYKKLAPYNVKQKSVDLDEDDVPFTPDEHKKRTEAANSVLRRTASRERAYVLSAAKKSNGSPTQEFPPLFAKRIEIEEEEGQQRRSPTVPGSCRLTPDDNSANGLRKTTAGSSWNEPKTTAVSPSSTETGSKSQPRASSSETAERISTSAEIRNGENRQAPNGKSSSEAVSQHGDGDKPLKEKPEPLPRDELAPRATAASTNGSYPEHTEAKNGFYPPKSNSGCRDRPADAPDKLHRQYETSHYLDDAKPEPARSVLGYEERSGTHESGPTSPEAPAYSKPAWNEATSSQDFKEGKTPRDRGHESTRASGDYKPELIQAGFLDNHAEKGQEPPDHDVHREPPRLKEHTEHEPSMTRSVPGSRDGTSGSLDINKGISPCVQSEEVTSRRSSSLPRGGSITAPETQCTNESDPCWERVTPAYEEQTCPTTESHRESRGDWRHNEPVAASRSNFSSEESALSTYETQHPVPLYMDRQPFNVSVSAPSHRIPSYADSQVFSTRRPTPDYEGRVYDGRSSPRNSRYDSASARGHCEFNPTAGRKGVLFVKEYVNSSELSASPRYGSGSLVDLTDLDRATYSHHSYLSSAPLQRSGEPVCSYCGREIRDCPKIIIEHLNICCHEYCFRCGICHKAMGDLLDKIFIHRDIVHCDKCYEKLF
ncbi:zinc finger protein 185 isoform X7 [Phalacrocorax aristotelis]|uniref:zinc finger protein 185 isoform X7 n=1 Tax=Phalacrocorax aristotelis TaxID=126867 RepID=UPI003F4C6D6F